MLVDRVVLPPARTGGSPRRTVPPLTSWLLAGGLATLGFGVVVQARRSGLLHGWPAVLVALALALAVPTAATLSRRILLAGCVGFGWLPVLWWQQLPVGSLGRVTLALATSAALLAGWVGLGARPVDRLRRLVPKVSWVDLLPLAAAGVTAVIVRPWLMVTRPPVALSLLMRGWDASAHADMTLMIRRYGATVDTLPPGPDGTPWSYGNYPQGFHVVAAGMTELFTQGASGPMADELMGFARACGLTLVAMVALLSAGVCALPAVRRNGHLAVPAVALIASCLAVGPGAAAMTDGHGNFLFAMAMAPAAGLVAVAAPRVPAPLNLAAVAGALVAVAHSWVLLLTYAVPAALVVVLPLNRARWRATPRAWVLSVLVGAATGWALLRAFDILRSVADVGASAVLRVPGGITAPPLGTTLALTAGAVGLCLVAGRRGRDRFRWRALAVAPVAGALVTIYIARDQFQVSTTVGYYFWKYAAGVEVLSAVLLVVAGAAVLHGARRPHPPSRTGSGARRWGGLPALTGSAVIALATTQLFGYAGPMQAAFVSSPMAPGVGLRSASVLLETAPAPSAARLLSAVAVGRTYPAGRVTYVSASPLDPTYSANADQWFRSLTQTWTQAAAGLESQLGGDGSPPSPASAAATAAVVLAADPGNLVVVGPDVVAQVREQLTDPTLRARVLSW